MHFSEINTLESEYYDSVTYHQEQQLLHLHRFVQNSMPSAVLLVLPICNVYSAWCLTYRTRSNVRRCCKLCQLEKSIKSWLLPGLIMRLSWRVKSLITVLMDLRSK